MKKLLSIAISFCLVLSIQAQANKIEEKPTPTVTAPSPTIIVEDVVNFGNVKKDSEAIRKVKITNKGKAPLLIANCQASCGCTAPTCPREPIMPGKSAEMSVQYKNTNVVGSFTKSVTIMSNDATTPAKVVTITGMVVDVPPAK